jgi:hypothetical protein
VNKQSHNGLWDGATLALLALAVLAAVAGTFGPPLATYIAKSAGAAPSHPQLVQYYQAAIRSAAIKTPQSAAPLLTLDAKAPRQTMMTFSTAPPTMVDGKLKYPIWVSVADQLHGFCGGNADKSLALTEALGLAPGGKPRGLYKLSVPTDSLFRPCASKTAITETACAASLPEQSTAPDPSTEPPTTADPQALIAFYRDKFLAWQSALPDAEREHFVLNQIMTSYQIGSEDKPGFPFTGMGWTYNWNPDASSPVGVSEFIVRDGTAIEVMGAPVSPGSFCGVE